MRRKFCKTGLLCLMLAVMLCACGAEDNAENEEIQTVESEPLDGVNADDGKTAEVKEPDAEEKRKEEADPETEELSNLTGEYASDNETAGKNETDADNKTDMAGTEPASAETDPYEGEYNSYDVDEPGLEIKRNDDGTYQIHVGIFRLVAFRDGVGMLTEKGIAFTATEIMPEGKVQTGVITLDGDVATVTFDPDGWEGFGGFYTYSYYKTSDTPDMNLIL